MYNKGKIRISDTDSIAVTIGYGDQSPMVDAVPLPWQAGDKRYQAGPNNNSTICWVCIEAGTPGVWISYVMPFSQIIYSQNYRYNGIMGVAPADTTRTNNAWSPINQYVYLAESGVDSRFDDPEAFPIVQCLAPVIEGGAQLIDITAYFTINDFAINFGTILYLLLVNQAGAAISPQMTVDGTLAGGFTGGINLYNGPPLVSMPANSGFSLLMSSAGFAGTGNIQMSAKVTAYKNITVYP